jgi:selenocysteine lyase/cysteine desulfurase
MLGIHALHASLDLLLETGITEIYDIVSRKIQYLIDILLYNGATILSATAPERRAGIVTFRLDAENMEEKYRNLQENGVICALRGGGIRFSPHFYTPDSVLDRALGMVIE